MSNFFNDNIIMIALTVLKIKPNRCKLFTGKKHIFSCFDNYFISSAPNCDPKNGGQFFTLKFNLPPPESGSLKHIYIYV